MRKTEQQWREEGWTPQPDGSWSRKVEGVTMTAPPQSILHPPKVPLWKEIVQLGEAASAKTPKLKLNKTEMKACALLEARGHKVWKQAITLALDPPFKSYRADLAFMDHGKLNLVEAKAPHRFARAGIAKAALAAKTYPEFRFLLFMWTKNGFHESELTP